MCTLPAVCLAATVCDTATATIIHISSNDKHLFFRKTSLIIMAFAAYTHLSLYPCIAENNFYIDNEDRQIELL